MLTLMVAAGTAAAVPCACRCRCRDCRLPQAGCIRASKPQSPHQNCLYMMEYLIMRPSRSMLETKTCRAWLLSSPILGSVRCMCAANNMCCPCCFNKQPTSKPTSYHSRVPQDAMHGRVQTMKPSTDICRLPISESRAFARRVNSTSRLRTEASSCHTFPGRT